MRTCSDACKNIEHTGISLSGIGLARHCHACGKAHFLRDHRVNLIDRLLISVKQFQKACLCTSRSLGTKQLHAAEHILQIFQIHQELLCPERCPFSDRCRLCRLKMSKSKRRL